MSKEARAARAANSSLHLTDQRFNQLTGQLRDAYAKLDGTLIETLHLHAAMIQTCQEMGVEPEIGQKLFSDFTECLGTLVNGRQQMVAAHTRATAIRMRTNQAARADGCWPFPGGGGIEDGSNVTHLQAA